MFYWNVDSTGPDRYHLFSHFLMTSTINLWNSPPIKTLNVSLFISGIRLGFMWIFLQLISFWSFKCLLFTSQHMFIFHIFHIWIHIFIVTLISLKKGDNKNRYISITTKKSEQLWFQENRDKKKYSGYFVFRQFHFVMMILWIKLWHQTATINTTSHTITSSANKHPPAPDVPVLQHHFHRLASCYCFGADPCSRGALWDL